MDVFINVIRIEKKYTILDREAKVIGCVQPDQGRWMAKSSNPTIVTRHDSKEAAIGAAVLRVAENAQ